MQKEITLVDRGRGLQLSTSRITVHDLVPYFQNGCSDDEIIRWIPNLTSEEIRIVERYYWQHRDELDEYEGVSELTARSRFGRSGFVSQSRKEASLSAFGPSQTAPAATTPGDQR